MNAVLDYLNVAEGSTLHYNSGELDITAPYGIYRHAHPDAKIFKYIDEVALTIGITSASSHWTNAVVTSVDNRLDSAMIRELACEFYEDYLSGAHLELFPEECKVAMMSMYTNSPKLAWKAVQRTLIALNKSGKLGVRPEQLSKVDGSFGSKTSVALKLVKEQVDPMYLETMMLFKMLCEYVELGNAKYLNGWKNRMDLLTELN